MFSGALTLTDLNDFITPSQACIKPIEQPRSEEVAPQVEVELFVGASAAPSNDRRSDRPRPPPPPTTAPAQISLDDCLACSGCITSAESVLITIQSHQEVLAVLSSNPPPSADGHRIPVLSISPQSLASLAASLSSVSPASAAAVSPRQVLHRVSLFCRRIGFEYVFDTTFARHLALLEHGREFAERRQNRAAAQNSPGKSHLQLPMLASACPGWVCYAEKSHPEMLPFISRTKSPQQVMGTLVKNWMAQKWSRKPNQIYHVTVMPCYDKKLEASRQDFYNDVDSTRDVDCVITTGELDRMIREHDFDLTRPLPSEDIDSVAAHHHALPSVQFERGFDTGTVLPELLTHPGSSSGAYLQTLLSQEQQRWWFAARDTTNGAALPRERAARHQPENEPKLTTRTLRTSDYEEYTLVDPINGHVLFRGARCYGFRNLQNLVRRVGRETGVQVGRGAAGRLSSGVRAKRRGGATMGKKAPAAMDAGNDSEDALVAAHGYDYVEVMACPSGCVNGGGQLRPTATASVERADDDDMGVEEAVNIDPSPSAKWGDRAWTKRVEQAYWHDLPTPSRSPSPPSSASTSTLSPSPSLVPNSLAAADALALRVLTDLCQPADGKVPDTWDTQLDEAAEARRRVFFRTEYRAVQSDVLGIQVQW